MLRLVDPFVGAKDSYRSLVAEINAAGEERVPFTLDYPHENFAALVARLLGEARGIGIAPGWVPHSTYWLMEGDQVVGASSLRHRLTPKLRISGGHIGYSIRPSARGRGLGKAILKLTLVRAAHIGIESALLTCADANFASAAVIVANGGELEAKEYVAERGVVQRRYWVPTDS